MRKIKSVLEGSPLCGYCKRRGHDASECPVLRADRAGQQDRPGAHGRPSSGRKADCPKCGKVNDIPMPRNSHRVDYVQIMKCGGCGSYWDHVVKVKE